MRVTLHSGDGILNWGPPFFIGISMSKRSVTYVVVITIFPIIVVVVVDCESHRRHICLSTFTKYQLRINSVVGILSMIIIGVRCPFLRSVSLQFIERVPECRSSTVSTLNLNLTDQSLRSVNSLTGIWTYGSFWVGETTLDLHNSWTLKTFHPVINPQCPWLLLKPTYKGLKTPFHRLRPLLSRSVVSRTLTTTRPLTPDPRFDVFTHREYVPRWQRGTRSLSAWRTRSLGAVHVSDLTFRLRRTWVTCDRLSGRPVGDGEERSVTFLSFRVTFTLSVYQSNWSLVITLVIYGT